MIPESYTLFIEFMAGKAAKAKEARYALGSKSVDIPLTKELFNEFAAGLNPPLTEKFKTDEDAKSWAFEQGYVSETGAQTGIFECRITHPPGAINAKHNTASTVQLAGEMESHVSLILNIVQESIPDITESQKQVFGEVKDKIFNNLNRDILLDQIMWLEKNTPKTSSRSGARQSDEPEPFILRGQTNEQLSKIASEKYAHYIGKVGEDGYYNFNTHLDEQRVKLGEKYRDQALLQLALRDESIEQAIKGNEKEICDLLPKTRASQSDTLFQNSATGGYSTTTGTQYVAHDKRLDKGLITQRIVQGPDSNVVWRLASAAAYDDYNVDDSINLFVEMEKERKLIIESDAQLIKFENTDPKPYNYHDMKEWHEGVKSNATQRLISYQKITQTHINYVKVNLGALSNEISDPKNGGDPNDFVYYNLLTSYDGYNDKGQTASTDIITRGIHELNKAKLDANQSNIVLLCNLPVNGFSKNKPEKRQNNPALRGGLEEIHDLADLSIIQMLNTVLGGSANLSPEGKEALSTAASLTLAAYTKFLLDPDSPPLFTQSKYMKDQEDALATLKKSADLTVFVNAPTPRERAAQVLLKMFMNGTYSDQKNGMLVQALMLVVETSKCSGCKSANERFASVLDKSVNVGDPAFMTAMDKYMVDGDEDALYGTMVDLYSQKSPYEGAGTRCSLQDQAGTSKVQIIKNYLYDFFRRKVDTNMFESRRIQRVNQDHSGKNQAHKLHDKSHERQKEMQKKIENHEDVEIDKIKPSVWTSMMQIGGKKLALQDDLQNFSEKVSTYKKINEKKDTHKVVSPEKQKERDLKTNTAQAIIDAINYLKENMGKLGDPQVNNQIQEHRRILLEAKDNLLVLGKTAKKSMFGSSSETTILPHLDKAISLCEEYSSSNMIVAHKKERDDEMHDDSVTTLTAAAPIPVPVPVPVPPNAHQNLMADFQQKVAAARANDPTAPDSIKPSAIRSPK